MLFCRTIVLIQLPVIWPPWQAQKLLVGLQFRLYKTMFVRLSVFLSVFLYSSNLFWSRFLLFDHLCKHWKFWWAFNFTCYLYSNIWYHPYIKETESLSVYVWTEGSRRQPLNRYGSPFQGSFVSVLESIVCIFKCAKGTTTLPRETPP